MVSPAEAYPVPDERRDRLSGYGASLSTLQDGRKCAACAWET